MKFKRFNDLHGKRAAFTLAEVLIALGIIGVVAAMTIPTLVNKVQKHEYVVALQKFYTTQMDGWSRLLADEGVQQLEDTSVFQSMGVSDDSDCSVSGGANSIECKPFFDALKKYFRVSVVTVPTSYKIKFLKGSYCDDCTGETVLSFADGSIMSYGDFYKMASMLSLEHQAQAAALGGHIYSNQALFDIDINGFKKPNVYGRDIFSFGLSGDGKLYPYDGKDDSLFSNGDLSAIWQKNTKYCGTVGSTDVSSANGQGCSARIMEEGWQMNY